MVQVQEAAAQGDPQASAVSQAFAIVQWLGTELQALDAGARIEAVRSGPPLPLSWSPLACQLACMQALDFEPRVCVFSMHQKQRRRVAQ